MSKLFVASSTAYALLACRIGLMAAMSPHCPVPNLMLLLAGVSVTLAVLIPVFHWKP